MTATIDRLNMEINNRFSRLRNLDGRFGFTSNAENVTRAEIPENELHESLDIFSGIA